MRKTTLLLTILAATLLAAPALATHWEDFSGMADCEGWSMTGVIVVGNLGISGHIDYTVTLSQGGMTVEEHNGSVPFDQTGPSNVDAMGSWSGELCGDFTAIGVFTIVADDIGGDPMRAFEVMFTCECDEPGEACNFTPGYWKNHPEDWPMADFAVGGEDYVQSELIEILQRPVRGDATVILAHHLIAAMLNVMGGSDDYIQGAIDDGNQFLDDHGLGSRPSGALKGEAIGIKNELAGYNELGCEEEEAGKSLPHDDSMDWGTLKTIYR